MISSKFNYIVLVKYSSLKSPKFFLTSLKNLKINELVFFYKNKKKKLATVISSPIVLENKNVKKMPFISGRANKLDIINYQKEMSKNNLIINVGNLEAKKKKLDIKILFCQYDREKNSCLLFFISKKKNILNFFFKYLKKLLKLRKIKYIPISSRDRAKIIGGIGSCGRKFCCNICKEITNFKKKNKLFLKNEKTLGFCNCLKCCLFFDDDNENK